MLARLSRSLSLLVNYLSTLHLNAAIPSLKVTASACHLSRAYIFSGSDDRRGGHSKEAKLERSFQLLGVNTHDCTVEQIRKAYTDLMKRYHPDSRTPHASTEKSAEVGLYNLQYKYTHTQCIQHSPVIRK